jgi:hypothetical protein
LSGPRKVRISAIVASGRSSGLLDSKAAIPRPHEMRFCERA